MGRRPGRCEVPRQGRERPRARNAASWRRADRDGSDAVHAQRPDAARDVLLGHHAPERRGPRGEPLDRRLLHLVLALDDRRRRHRPRPRARARRPAVLVGPGPRRGRLRGRGQLLVRLGGRLQGVLRRRSSAQISTLGTSLSPGRASSTNNTYYWRVRAIDPSDNAGVWNEGPTFTKTFDNVPPVIDARASRTSACATTPATRRSTPTPGPPSSTPTCPSSRGIPSRRLRLHGERDRVRGRRLRLEPAASGTPTTSVHRLDAARLEQGRPAIPTRRGPVHRLEQGADRGCRVLRPRAGLRPARRSTRRRPSSATGRISPPTTSPPSSGPGLRRPQRAGRRARCRAPATTTGPSPARPSARCRSSPGIRSPAPRATTCWSRAIRASRTSSTSPTRASLPTRLGTSAGSVGYADETTLYYWAVLPADNANGSGVSADPLTSGPQNFRSSRRLPTSSSPIGGAVGQHAGNGVPVGRRARRAPVPAPGGRRPDVLGTLIDDVVTDSSSYTSNTTYPSDTTLYWRVRADAEDGSGAVGLSWSESGTFTKQLPKPVSDPDNPTTGGFLPTIKWSTVPGAVSYDLHVVEPDGQARDFRNIPAPAGTFIEDDRGRRVHVDGARELPDRRPFDRRRALLAAQHVHAHDPRAERDRPKRSASAACSSSGIRGRAPTTTASRSPRARTSPPSPRTPRRRRPPMRRCSRPARTRTAAASSGGSRWSTPTTTSATTASRAPSPCPRWGAVEAAPRPRNVPRLVHRLSRQEQVPRPSR